VRVFDRSPELFRAPLAGVDYRFGDFSDVPLLAEALEGVDLVYHLLSTTVPSTSNLDPIADVNGNLVNSLRLLQLMVQKNIPKIIYLSSGGTVYGIPECVPIPETHPLRPICSYGVVKVAIENYLHMFHELHGLQYVVLRASNPYGERQGHAGVQGVIGTFMQKILAGDQIEIWGDGRVVRDYIYVGDLAELCVIAGRPEKVGVFNAGSGEGTSINELINKLTSVTGMNLTYVNRTGRGYDVPRVVLDIGSTVSNFGWLPSTTLDHGLITTWNWFLEGA